MSSVAAFTKARRSSLCDTGQLLADAGGAAKVPMESAIVERNRANLERAIIWSSRC